MTNPNLASQVITDDKLEGLCKVLRQDRYQPSAIQLLYFLLQPAVEHNVQQWSQLGQAIRKSHHQNLQISTFGIVPDGSEKQNGDEESVWGVASLYADEKFAEPRARFWISTETNARPSNHSGNQPKWQPDEQGLAILDTMFRTFFRPFLQRHGGTSIFFNGTNQCWTEHLGGFGSNTFDNLCSKAVRKFDLHAETKVECPPGYRLRPLEEKDIQTVRTESSYRRKVTDRRDHSRSSHQTKSRSRRHTLGHAYSCQLPLSTMRPTNSLHGHSPTPTVRLHFPHHGSASNTTDSSSPLVSVGALHTAPAYRKRGLAPVVVAELGNSIRRALAENRLTSEVMKDSFWVHADSEADNVVAIKWFCSLGFVSSIDNTWTRILL